MTRPTDIDLRDIIADQALMSDDNPRRNKWLEAMARELLASRPVAEAAMRWYANPVRAGLCNATVDYCVALGLDIPRYIP